MEKTEFNNITPRILDKIGRKLHNQPNHPIQIIKKKIYQIIGEGFATFDELSPYVSVEDNFDSLLIPPDHPARSKSDTYYLNEKTVLRTHTSAHQSTLLKSGETKFLVTGDVYRKDEIDRCHYPVFHQMEGLCLVNLDSDPEEELKRVLVGLIEGLFPGCEYRFNDDYFPFTHPSFEVEILYGEKWLEVLGCGVTQPKILENCGLKGKQAWAFGLGLERLAMVLFQIPDIRYFWSIDRKFLDQFNSGEIVRYQPFSTLEPVKQDISFWIPESGRNEEGDWKDINDFYDLVRNEAGDLIDSIECYDTFFHPKNKMLSKAFRLTYSPPDTKLNDPGGFKEVVIECQNKLRDKVESSLTVTLR